ncbi:tyrosine-type recombinase/integrase [Paraburkholderia youngii]|uniref:Site-specific integrase n=1 Tax=Paraburkholderia youngii TaxID=2782701 RepID=A0A7Y6JU72_9BURK|nr:site-specific integrase [Paraburkholderia youngii]NUX98795.1 site-specific integrase [Paraburkholderia youngii]
MGTITQRENGKWQVKIRRAGTKAISATFHTYEDAKAFERQQEHKVDKGVLGQLDGTPTLSQIITRYLTEVTPSKKGADSEEWRLKAIQRHWIGSTQVGKLTSTIVAKWRDERLQGADGRPVSGSTVNREMNLLHHVLETARKDWGIGTAVNPVSEVRRPKNNPSRDRRLTDEEKAVLLEACRDTRKPYLPQIVELALETAMRQGEIVSLMIEQVDLKDSVVSLKAGATKTDEARTVPLSTRANAILKEAIGDRTEGRVWPGLTSEAVKKAFIRARERAGIENVKFHDTRHDATTSFVELGLTDTEVMSITGHKTQSMMRRYTHLRAKDLAKKLG